MKGGEKMKRSLSLVVTMGFLLVLSSGCATREYVRQQIEPILDRLSKVETCCENAKKCCEESKKCCVDSEGAAKRAEAAAKKAEAAAEKCTKSFELQQRK